MTKIFLVLILSCIVLILRYVWTSSSLGFKERYIRPGKMILYVHPRLELSDAHPKIINQYFSLSSRSRISALRNKMFFQENQFENKNLINHPSIAINTQSGSINTF